MTYYIRIGNRTLNGSELQNLTPDDIKKIEEDAEVVRKEAEAKKQAEVERLLGLNRTKNVTIDVRPSYENKVASAEEVTHIAEELAHITEEVNTLTGKNADQLVTEETSATKTKKPKKTGD